MLIIVMNGGNDENGVVSGKFEKRLQGTIEEYEKHPGSKILVQGGFGHFNSSSQSSAYHATNFLISRGVTESDIYAIQKTTSTVEEALSAQRVLQNFPKEDVCVVTSKFHLERTKLVFEHFFDPEQLRFVGTPNGVSPEELIKWKQHETRGLKLLRNQGGVILEGQLFTRRKRKT